MRKAAWAIYCWCFRKLRTGREADDDVLGYGACQKHVARTILVVVKSLKQTEQREKDKNG
jgi:hypothetical protein